MHVNQRLQNPEDPTSGIPRNMTALPGVLKQAGYALHQVGKWDAGMATVHHTPWGRGFDTSFGYFEHKNDMWSFAGMQSLCLSSDDPSYRNLTDLWDTEGPSNHTLTGDIYEEDLFRDRILNIVQSHDLTAPLGLVYTPHVAHCPLQIPEENFRFMQGFIPGDTDEGACEAQTSADFCDGCTSVWPGFNETYRSVLSSLLPSLPPSPSAPRTFSHVCGCP